MPEMCDVLVPLWIEHIRKYVSLASRLEEDVIIELSRPLRGPSKKKALLEGNVSEKSDLVKRKEEMSLIEQNRKLYYNISQVFDIGLLLFPMHQWLDAAGAVDYLNSHSQNWLKLLHLPQAFIDKAPIINWHYISHSLEPIQATSGPLLLPSCTYADCPTLDYIVIPGPDFTEPIPEGCAEFLKTRWPILKGILTVCSGSMAIAPTGLLDGLNVCSNKLALKMAHDQGLIYRKVNWVKDRRWIVDGKVWSAAGVTSGIDLAAEFARVHFHPEIVEMAKNGAEYEPKPDQPDVFAKILEGVEF